MLSSSNIPSLDDDIRRTFKPLLASQTAPSWHKEMNEYYAITEPSWTSMLGKDVCIADIDTKLSTELGRFSSDGFRWSTTDYLSAGLLNHFLYGT